MSRRRSSRLVADEPLDPDDLCDELFELLEHEGATRYDEEVSQLDHALQSAALAEAHGAVESLQIAALLHDIGHLLLGEHDGRSSFLDEDLRHEAVGARLLAQWFGATVSGPVALHVKAKRYLVSTDPAYGETLSLASTRSLELQGGVMDATEIEAFRARPYADAAIALRQWDDSAKVAGAEVPDLAHWSGVVRQLARFSRRSTSGAPK